MEESVLGTRLSTNPNISSQMNQEVVKTKEERCRIVLELNEQRLQGKLCDTVLIVEGQEFPAHLCVLITISGFFKGLCDQRSIAKDHAREIHLPERIKASTVAQILGYIYLGQVEICNQTVIDLLYAADFLLIPELKLLCHSFLVQTLSCHNCVEYMKIAYVFGITPVYLSAQKIIKSRLLDHIIHTDDLWHLGDPSELKVVLLDEKIKDIISPRTLYNIIKSWVQFNDESRCHYFQDLFEELVVPSLQDIPFDVLKTLLADDYVIKYSSCLKQLESAFIRMSSGSPASNYHRPGCDSPPNKRIRNDCGIQESELGSSREIKAESSSVQEDTSHRCLDSETRCNHLADELSITNAEYLDVVVVNGLGDKSNFAYVVCEDRWLHLPDLPEKRTNHGMTQLGDKLFLIGGLHDAYAIAEDYLDLRTGSWGRIPPTNHPHLNVQSVLVHHDDIFVIDSVGKSERYFPATNTWTSVYPFQPKRTNAIVTTASHNTFDLYMCYVSETEDPNAFGVPTRFQVYLIDEDAWRELAPPRLDDGSFWKLKHHDQLISQGDYLYLINPIEGITVKYEPKAKLWSTSPDLSFPACPKDIIPANTYTSITRGEISLILDISPKVSDATVMFGVTDITNPGQEWLWKSPPPFSLVSSYVVKPVHCHTKISQNFLSKCPPAQYSHSQIEVT